MKIAYLTNQYPHVRHTFIRREIAAVESAGIDVRRFSIRDTRDACVDPADIAEYARTTAILNVGKLKLLVELLRTALTRPLRFLSAACGAWRLGGRLPRGRLRHWVYLAEAAVLRRRLVAEGCRHLHVHFGTNPAAVAWLCRRLGGPRYSLTIHGSEEWDYPEALSLRDKYAEATFVAAVTDYGRAQVIRWAPPNREADIHVVRCGVDRLFRDVEPTPVPDTDHLVVVGALDARKGQRYAIEAIALLAQQGKPGRLLFIGDGPDRPMLEQTARVRGVTSRIEFAGKQPGAEVLRRIRDGRALLVPGMAENLPVVLMEAMASARPVIAPMLAGIPELVVHGVNGRLYPVANVSAMAEAISAILSASTDHLSVMGRDGRRAILERHDAERSGQLMKELFERYAGR